MQWDAGEAIQQIAVPLISGKGQFPSQCIDSTVYRPFNYIILISPELYRNIYMILPYWTIYSKNKPSHWSPTCRSGNSPSRAWRTTSAGLQSRSSPQGRFFFRQVGLGWSALGPNYVKLHDSYVLVVSYSYQRKLGSNLPSYGWFLLNEGWCVCVWLCIT